MICGVFKDSFDTFYFFLSPCNNSFRCCCSAFETLLTRDFESRNGDIPTQFDTEVLRKFVRLMYVMYIESKISVTTRLICVVYWKLIAFTFKVTMCHHKAQNIKINIKFPDHWDYQPLLLLDNSNGVTEIKKCHHTGVHFCYDTAAH